MIETELSLEPGWPDLDWEALALRAARAAVSSSAHGPLLDAAARIEISVRLTENDEVQALNRQHRGKNKPTNVLSFPMVQPDLLDTIDQNSDDGEVLLGDIVLARGVCTAEAEEKGATMEAHATHLIVHGTLHLLGYDHELGDAEADHMEDVERAALASLGIADPYLIRED